MFCMVMAVDCDPRLCLYRRCQREQDGNEHNIDHRDARSTVCEDSNILLRAAYYSSSLS